MSKKFELWEGYEVEINQDLIDDYDFVTELSKAAKEKDIPTLITMYFSTVGGEKVFNDVREHIIAEKGHFSIKAIGEIIAKIDEQFPKDGKLA